MEDVTLIFGNENSYNLIEGETPNICISITIKKDYSKTVSKIRKMAILNDVEKALNELKDTKEFKKLVDSYGSLTMTDIIREDPETWREKADQQIDDLIK